MREQFDVHPDTLSGHGAAVVALAPELEGVESEVRAQRLSPAPVSVWSELGVFSDVWTDALNAIGGALDYFGRSLADAAGSYAVADSSAAQGLSRSSSLSMGM